MFLRGMFCSLLNLYIVVERIERFILCILFVPFYTNACQQVIQIGKLTTKFFTVALWNNEEENELNYEFIDCCLGSASIIISFLETLEVDWKLSSSGALNYVKAIGDMVDFRIANNVSDLTWWCFHRKKVSNP